MSIIIKIGGTALALLLCAAIVPGIAVSSFYVALIAAIVLGLLNLIVRPILFILTLPITLLTFGLFAFVINALLFMFAASFLEGFDVAGFIPALIGSIVVSVVATVIDTLLS